MTYRQRFLNTLSGRPIDRLPFIEWGLYTFCFGYSQWGRYIGKNTDPRVFFGFDNSGFSRGYEGVPIDWFALPRFKTRDLSSADGYLRRVEPLFGQVVRELPRNAERPMEVRIFEEHPVKTEDDWLRLKDRFTLSTEGRFPADWDRWCEHSRNAQHPIALVLRGPSKALDSAIGLEGEKGIFYGIYDRPDFVKEILDHFTKLTLLCAEKALQDARIDLIVIIDEMAGNSGLLFSPEILNEFFLPPIDRFTSLASSYGLEIVLLYQRGNLNDAIDVYRSCGITGLIGVEDHNGMHLEELLKKYGNRLCFLGGIDGRVLRETKGMIEAEVEYKVDLSRHSRVIPCLSTHVYPEIEFSKYYHYVRCLKRALGVN
jgi:hypothetical protein